MRRPTALAGAPAKMGASLAAIGLAALVVRAARRSRTKPPPAPRDGADLRRTPVAVAVSLQVNGHGYDLILDPCVSLLDCLREHLHLTGTKKGCDQGACGACTVLLDGERINACLTLAVQCEGAEITTIEGLEVDRVGSAVQEAFVTHDGLQCGYCTPGQICSVVAMLAEADASSPSAATHELAGPAIPLNDAEIKERMAGNLCRCGGCIGIFAAIRDVRGRQVAR
jgi:xanthine dehydrogenase YagT iron-sulfur-binding subunit